MFQRKKERTLLDQTIDNALLELNRHEVTSKEYAQALVMVERLQALQDTKSSRLSKDTVAVVGANLLGILMIIKHESVNVIGSKAMSLLIKPRI